MNDTLGTKVKRDKKKEKEILVEISLEEEPENPYKNLGVIGDCMWKWQQYFDSRKKIKNKKK